MPVTADALRDEYADAVERMAGRALDALAGGGGAVVFPDPPSTAELAAVRVLGPDVFAPALMDSRPPDPETATVVASAFRVFPPADGPGAHASPAVWRDWAAGRLAVQAGAVIPAVAAPERPPQGGGWQAWSLAMAQLSALALPGLEGPVHDAARRDPLSLSRGAVRALLRRDHRTAVRLTRWLAWSERAGVTLPVEVPPMLVRLRQIGDGSARSALEMALADRLSAESARHTEKPPPTEEPPSNADEPSTGDTQATGEPR
ncbi:hypothetical protein [Streptodolium elevatio]|uniref:Uncharacterized protein n=1 Tax=Streptodolium elevatio TaxID=3157996 RepID=A0ABV3DCH1_9ACTN